MNGCVSVSEAAKIKNVTRQAIYAAIKLNKLRAYRQNDHWKVFMADLNDYDEKKYSREHHSLHEGKPIYDEKRGLISVDKASKLIEVPRQKLYYAIRANKLKAEKKNAAWVVQISELYRYLGKLNKKIVNKNYMAL